MPQSLSDPRPAPARRNLRRSRRQSPKGSTRVCCYKNAWGLGRNIAQGVLDVSETGVRLLLKAEVRVRQEVEINLEGISSRTYKVVGDVVWVVPTADGLWCAGVSFQKPLPYLALGALAAEHPTWWGRLAPRPRWAFSISAVFMAVALVCHGELARDRPPQRFAEFTRRRRGRAEARRSGPPPARRPG